MTMLVTLALEAWAPPPLPRIDAESAQGHREAKRSVLGGGCLDLWATRADADQSSLLVLSSEASAGNVPAF